MALFVFSSLPDWFRSFAYFLESQWAGYAQLMLSKIYHWYAFTIGQIYNWYRFTVQSVEAFFQQDSPPLRPSYQDASVTARHRAVLISFRCNFAVFRLYKVRVFSRYRLAVHADR